MTTSSTLDVGDQAPDFTLLLPDSTPFKLYDHLPVALFFFRGTT